ncbi:MAG TPA: calcium-binding protein, partial [Bauldia sp.]|nr:calcium-binding protein [Bauldia sp.]
FGPVLEEAGGQAFDVDAPYSGNHRDSDPWGAVSLLLSGNDTILIDPAVDYQVRTTIGDNAGNDKFLGGVVDDYFEASQGNDYYDGGTGRGDTLSYSWPTYDGRNGASKGIILDAIGKKVKALGTVKDSWGNIDTFRNIEQFQGSKFADKMSGANQAQNGPKAYGEWFFGFGGSDTIDGRGGWDWVSHEEDVDFGGMKGIVANLFVVDKKGFASIKDGFGSIDKVKNVEAVMGTNFKDTMIGNNKDNAFQGLVGNDIIDGKGGKDFLTFWKNERYVGGTSDDGKVHMDLSGLPDINGYFSVDDGLGGTDLVKNVEGAFGSKFDDTFIGNAGANEFYAQGGDDILDGKEGHDILEGGDGSDEFHFSVAVVAANSDEVYDFNSGDGDRIVLHASAFTALSAYIGDNDIGSAFAANAGGVVSAGVYIAYDTNNGNLYYDADSDGAGAKVLIAHLGGTPGVSFDDFDVVA